jgi:hypothetical protein
VIVNVELGSSHTRLEACSKQVPLTHPSNKYNRNAVRKVSE